MQHFLLIYNHADSKLVTQTEFDDGSADEATAAYRDAEAAHATDTNIEIVLIGADSIDTIHRTHGHYFSTDDAVERYLTTA